jgi:hypothetical protein
MRVVLVTVRCSRNSLGGLVATARLQVDAVALGHFGFHVDTALEVGAVFQTHARRDGVTAHIARLPYHHSFLLIEVAFELFLDSDDPGTAVGLDGTLSANSQMFCFSSMVPST